MPLQVERRRLQGVLHVVVSLVLLVGLFWTDGWHSRTLLLGKLVSYGASVNYHWHGEQIGDLVLDWLAIPVSMWASSCVFAMGMNEALGITCVLFAVSRVNWIIGQRELVSGESKARCTLMGVYFLACIMHIGYRTGWCWLWGMGTVLYMAAFSVSPPVAHALQYEGWWWHAEGRNGFHEDFHMALAAADAVFVYMGLKWSTTL